MCPAWVIKRKWNLDVLGTVLPETGCPDYEVREVERSGWHTRCNSCVWKAKKEEIERKKNKRLSQALSDAGYGDQGSSSAGAA